MENVESVADLIRKEGSRALPLVANVTDENDVKNMIDKTIKESGRTDILINNAAYARAEDRVPILDLDESCFSKSCGYKIDWNFFMYKGAVEHMIKQEMEARVNISSTAGKKGQENF